MFKSFFLRRTIKNAFGRYLTPEMAKKIANDPVGPDRTERSIDIAFVFIAASDAARFSERTGTVADIAIEHGGVVHELIPIVSVVFGGVFEAPVGARLRFVADIQLKVPEAAVLNGSVVASVGSFGGRSRFTFGFWWPGIHDAFRNVLALRPGQIEELPTQAPLR